MADVLTPKQRTFCMSRIRSKNTSPEVMLRKHIFKAGFRYKIRSNLVGKPDIVFSKEKVVIFVDGCFWHGCSIHSKLPSTNTEYWSNKIMNNQNRDNRVTKELEAIGWLVIRFWEHDVKTNIDSCVNKIKSVLIERRMLPAQ